MTVATVKVPSYGAPAPAITTLSPALSPLAADARTERRDNVGGRAAKDVIVIGMGRAIAIGHRHLLAKQIVGEAHIIIGRKLARLADGQRRVMLLRISGILHRIFDGGNQIV